MKFGKRLKRQIEETLPEWRSSFLSYKELKKLVRHVSASSEEAEADFVRLLDEELDKLNAFFIEKEEDFVIRQSELHERIRFVVAEYGQVGEAEYAAEMGRVRKDIVDLHGEMVLLENYSSINYTGLAKILKKYDKRTGRLLRLPFIERVLKEPFFTTDLVSRLVKQCEGAMDAVFPAAAPPEDRAAAGGGGGGGGGEAAAAAEQSIFRSTVAALATMRELRKGSSTYSHFSLPPLAVPDTDLLQLLPSPIPIQ